jgi:hypothetical protein
MSFTPKFQTIWNSIIKNKILSIIFQKQGFYLMISKSRLVKYSLRYVALRQILNLQEFIKMLLPPNFMFFQSSLAIPWSTPWRKEKKQKFSIRHGVLHDIFLKLFLIILHLIWFRCGSSLFGVHDGVVKLFKKFSMTILSIKK